MNQNMQEPAISIIMITHNVEKYIKNAIDSIVKQSFSDFECIIVDTGSTDATTHIIDSYTDERIILIKAKEEDAQPLHDRPDLIRGKYIALMDSENTMHADRLKIQHATLESEPFIAVCGSWMTCTYNDPAPQCIIRTLSGVVEDPLITFMQNNFLYYSTTMIRKSFLTQHDLPCENYLGTKALGLWIEIAKREGNFYIDNQSLVYCCNPDANTENKKNEYNPEVFNELIRIIEGCKYNYPELSVILTEMQKLAEKEIISPQDILLFYQRLLIKNRNIIVLT